MTTTWFSVARHASLKLIRWPIAAISRRSRGYSLPSRQEELNDYQELAGQVRGLMAVRRDILIPLMANAMSGSKSPDATAKLIHSFDQRILDLKQRCTHPALAEIRLQLEELDGRDYRSEDTYQSLIHLKLSIEEADRAISQKRHDLKRRHPRRTSANRA